MGIHHFWREHPPNNGTDKQKSWVNMIDLPASFRPLRGRSIDSKFHGLPSDARSPWQRQRSAFRQRAENTNTKKQAPAVGHCGNGCGCQNQWDPILGFFGAPHFRTYFSGDWDVHWGCGVLTHGQMEPGRKYEMRLANRTNLKMSCAPTAYEAVLVEAKICTMDEGPCCVLSSYH